MVWWCGGVGGGCGGGQERELKGHMAVGSPGFPAGKPGDEARGRVHVNINTIHPIVPV